MISRFFKGTLTAITDEIIHTVKQWQALESVFPLSGWMLSSTKSVKMAKS